MMICFRMTQIILLAAVDLKIVAVLIETAAIVVIDGPIRVVVIDESIVMYETRMLPE